MANHLNKLKRKAVTIGEGYRQYFELYIHEEEGVFLFAKEKAEVIERERDLCGYFVIVTSKKMSAKEALELYKSRDASEKQFSEIRAIWEIRACGSSPMRRRQGKSSLNLLP